MDWSNPYLYNTVQQVLSCNVNSAKTDIMTRYCKFFKTLRVRMWWPRLTFRHSAKVKDAIVQSEAELVPAADKWRIPLLSKLLDHRQELVYMGEDIDTISDQVHSLCIN